MGVSFINSFQVQKSILYQGMELELISRRHATHANIQKT